MSTMGHNAVAGERLRSFIERLERIASDKKNLTADGAAVMAEAKAEGFVPDAIRYCIKVRAMKPHDRQEAEALRDVYLDALGMAEEPPLFRHVGLMTVDTASRESVLEVFRKLVPQTGDIIVRMGGKPVRMWRDKKGEAHVEDYVEAAAAPATRRSSSAPAAPAKDVPDVDDAGALALGREYAQDNRPVIDNPFPYGDTRRAKFDEGWRKETGGDGMGGPDE